VSPIAQVSPQAPQFVLVPSGVSQPVAALASQLPKPALQLPSAQVPLPQLAVAFAREQATLQPPQWVLLVNACSQPLDVLLSQLPKPLLHAPKTQLPVAQLSVAPGKSQVVLHALQFAVLVRGASQPVLARRSQSPKPPLQAPSAQVPVLQLSPAFARSHVAPHAPQFVVELSGVSQPLAAFRSQLPKPALQVPSVQVPLPQLAVALARLQEMPQPPQFALVVVACSQPLLASLSQLPKFALHAPSVQVPVLQLAAALGRLHATLQAAQ